MKSPPVAALGNFVSENAYQTLKQAEGSRKPGDSTGKIIPFAKNKVVNLACSFR